VGLCSLRFLEGTAICGVRLDTGSGVESIVESGGAGVGAGACTGVGIMLGLRDG
jgi:hypothetical protein